MIVAAILLGAFTLASFVVTYKEGAFATNAKINYTCIRQFSNYKNISNSTLYKLFKNSSKFGTYVSIVETCEYKK